MALEHASSAVAALRPHSPNRPPLPPPPAVNSQGGPSPLRRLAVQRPTISTALAPQQGAYLHPYTPASAASLSTPFSPYASSSLSTLPSTAPSSSSSPMALRSASSLVTSYNPQEWTRHGPVSGSYMPYSSPQSATDPNRTRNMTGMEGKSMLFS